MESIGFRAGLGGRSRSAVGGIVLAAGLSRRFGGNKLLAPFMGKPLVRRVVEAALDSRLANVVVVLGHEHARVRAVLADLEDDARLTFACNDRYQQGQASSVVAGLAAIDPAVGAAMFLPADQPLLDDRIVDRLIAAFEQGGGDICHPVVAGRRCSPAIFGSRHFPALRRLQGDSGGRSVIEANRAAVTTVAFADEGPFRDVDSPEDLAALCAHSLPAEAGHKPAQLVQALGLDGARVVAICGAGGKTSLMAALARELGSCGERVLATTTTKMAIEEADAPWRPCEVREADPLIAWTEGTPAPVLAYRALDGTRGRLIGLRPETVDALARAGGFDRIIVEADGAARKPLKAPAAHEPAFPALTDAVVIVAGASGLGQPLDDRAVFRPERWTALTGLQRGQPVTPESLARVVVHADGLARGAPPRARRMLLINQAEAPERLAAAERVINSVFGLTGLVPERAAAGWLQPAPTIRLMRERARCSEALA